MIVWSTKSFMYMCCFFVYFQVAWIKSDSKAILGIHTHMVSLNPRLSVTHNGHNTWKLHISHVQLNDSGSYMCQVNTDPMKSQVSAYQSIPTKTSMTSFIYMHAYSYLHTHRHTHTHNNICTYVIYYVCTYINSHSKLPPGHLVCCVSVLFNPFKLVYKFSITL